MIVFTTLHDFNFNCLAELTLDKNKKIYCEKHNYPLLVKTDNWKNIPIGFEKAFLIFDAFKKYSNCDWVFFSECDTLITNMDIKLENIIKNEQKHFVITTDLNGINAGSFFVRNSLEGKEFLIYMINSIGIFPNEQEFIIH
jgi:mannan polymerase II complex MNN10 subunit